MAKFEYTFCGKRCNSFGKFLKIERYIKSGNYYCQYGITNEIFPSL